jgi:hypothetical protein
MIRRVGLALLLTSCGLTVFAGQATAASTSTIGQLFVPNDNSCMGDFTALQSAVASGSSYTVATGGVITSWSFLTGSSAVPNLKLKVGRPLPNGSFRFIGEGTAGPQSPNTVNTYPANIPVQVGDVIGIHTNSGSTAVPCSAFPTTPDDRYVRYEGDPATNSAAPPSVQGQRSRFPVTATVTAPGAIRLGKPILNRARGTAIEPVFVPNPGRVTLKGKGVVRQRTARASVSRAVHAAGIVNLLVKAKGKRKRKLANTGRVKVRITITYTPIGGDPSAHTKKIRLRERRG